MKKNIFFIVILFAGLSFSAEKIWSEGENLVKVPTVNLPDFSALSEAVKDSVVNIYTTQIAPRERFMDPQAQDLFEFFFGGQMQPMPQEKGPQPQSLGTGFIISQKGYILTNYHVVKDAQNIRVQFATDKMSSKGISAKLIGRDPELDIALLKVDEVRGLRAISLGDSDALKIGEWVVAIGNPFGLGITVSKGIISAKHRNLNIGGYENYLQTDASINPGNSGGPLFNMKGEVIGINTMIIAGAQGIGFAIPINMVKDFIPQLLEKGKVNRGFLGVVSAPLTSETKEELSFPADTEGVLIANVDQGTPAAKAGLKSWDILTKFNEISVENPMDLSIAVAKVPVGKKVPVEVFRKGKTFTVTVTLAERPEKEGLYGMEKLHGEGSKKNEGVGDKKVDKIFGLSLTNNSAVFRQKYNLPTSDGVLVLRAERGSKGVLAGIQPGDIIDSINGEVVSNVKDLSKYIEGSKRNSFILRVRRGVGYFFTSIKKT